MTAKRSRSAEPTTPDVLTDQTTPRGFMPQDHSFTLQAIMELQKTTAQLTEAINSMRTSVDRQSTKIEKLEDKVSGVTHKLYAAGVVLAITVALGGFIINKAWDLMIKQLTSAEVAAQSAPPPSPPAGKTKAN